MDDKYSELHKILADCDLIDIDFSNWDFEISLWVVADHMPFHASKRPIFELSFKGVKTFLWNFSGRNSEDQVGQNSHYKWNIYKSQITDHGGLVEIELSGSPQMPKILIKCESISTMRKSHSELDAVNPNWANPHGSLARPSLSILASSIRGQ